MTILISESELEPEYAELLDPDFEHDFDKVSDVNERDINRGSDPDREAEVA